MGKSKVLFVNEELTKEELCLDILHHARESFRIYARVLLNNVACGNSECDMGWQRTFTSAPVSESITVKRVAK
jgi:hypothetical protein